MCKNGHEEWVQGVAVVNGGFNTTLKEIAIWFMGKITINPWDFTL